MEGEVAKEPSTSEETAKSLLVVCAPGDGAFSVYMFLRYTLAQLSDPQISDVKLTMLCRENEEEQPKRWWKAWSGNTYLQEKLGFSNGWEPEFSIPGEILSNKPLNADHSVFILAGGDRSHLIRTCLRTLRNNHSALILTEQELVEETNGKFCFFSALSPKTQLPINDISEPLSPIEGLSAVESAYGKNYLESIQSSGHRIVARNIITDFDVRVQIKPYLHSHDLSRLYVKLTPEFTIKSGPEYSLNRYLKLYLEQKFHEFRKWRKSIRIQFDIENEVFNQAIMGLSHRVVDFLKSMRDIEINRSRYLSQTSVLFTPKNKNESTLNSDLIWLPWDLRNEGRSVQLLSYFLEKPSQSVLISAFLPEEGDTDYDNIFVQELIKIQTQGLEANLWIENLDHIDASYITSTVGLMRELETKNSVRVVDIGINGPSLKNLLDTLGKIGLLESDTFSVLSRNDTLSQFVSDREFSTFHRSFIRGALVNYPREQADFTFEKLAESFLQGKSIARYAVWLRSVADDRFVNPLVRKYCLLDEDGKLIKVISEKHQYAFECLLYFSLESYRYRLNKSNIKKFELALPFPLGSGYEQKGHHGSFAGFINPELWLFHQNDSESLPKVSVIDAKAFYEQTNLADDNRFDPRDVLDKETELLQSRYNWETVSGGFSVIPFSPFGGLHHARSTPHLFEFHESEMYQRLQNELQSIDLADLARYILHFVDEQSSLESSYAMYSKTQLLARFPMVDESKTSPSPEQTYIEVFMGDYPNHQTPVENADEYAAVNQSIWRRVVSFLLKKLPSGPTGQNTKRDENHYCSGFFYKPGQENSAFHFYNEPVTKVAQWALNTLNLHDVFQVQTPDSKVQFSLIRIVDKQSNEWIISLEEFLAISNLSLFKLFLNNSTKRVNEYRVFSQGVENKNPHELFDDFNKTLPFMKPYLSNLSLETLEPMPGSTGFDKLSTMLMMPIEHLVSDVLMFQKMGYEAFDVTFLTELLNTDHLEFEFYHNYESTLDRFCELQGYCIDAMYNLFLSSAKSIDSKDEDANDEDAKARFLNTMFFEQKFEPANLGIKIKEFRRKFRTIVGKKSRLFDNDSRVRYTDFEPERIRRSSQSSQSDA